jgi:putative spermidine/putrescine transport system substrate-binding protein
MYSAGNRHSIVTARCLITAMAMAAWCGMTITASAQTVLTVFGYGGSYGAGITEKLLPEFEKACHCKVSYTGSPAMATVARVIAEKDHPSIDVAFADDGPAARLGEMGLLAPLDPAKVPNLADVYPIGRVKGDLGVWLGIDAIGITYNTKYFADHGWAPLTSFNDLARPELKGKVAFPSISTALGIAWLIVEAKEHGGSEANIDPGFAAIAKIKGNALLFEKTADLAPLYQQGTIVAGIMANHRTGILAKQGFPIAFVYPKEGAVASVQTINVVKGAPHADLAQAFVNFMLSRPAQELIANTVYSGPLNRTADMSPEATKIAVTSADVGKLVALDWNIVNANIGAWTERWNKEIEEP